MSRKIRIFISSPGDVHEERDCARAVIQQLQRHFAAAIELQPLFWEDLPLQPDTSFQQGIDCVLSDTEGVDIAVFILWSRLGSPIGGMTRKSDGTPYRSGTEREFDLMMAARKASNGNRPAMLFYKRDDPYTFARNLGNVVVTSDEAGSEMIQQLRLAKDFIREQFHDDQGHNIGAYISYEKPFAFSNRLRIHLTQLIDSILEKDGLALPARWTKAPYRGLESFEAGDAMIFHGRDEEIQQVVERLAIREENEGCAFVVVVGASGSGKSSLAKAGVVPAHTHLNEDSFGTTWRVVILVTSMAITSEGRSLFEGFADMLVENGPAALFEGLPEILQQVCDKHTLATYLRNEPQTALTLVIRPALKAASAAASKSVKLLVVIDQMEEIFGFNDK